MKKTLGKVKGINLSVIYGFCNINILDMRKKVMISFRVLKKLFFWLGTTVKIRNMLDSMA